jgi:hypothetical protein
LTQINYSESVVVSIRDAAQYIMKLREGEQQATHWQTAAEMRMLVGEHGDDPMFPYIAMMKALRPHQPKPASTPRRKTRQGLDPTEHRRSRNKLPSTGPCVFQVSSWAVKLPHSEPWGRA